MGKLYSYLKLVFFIVILALSFSDVDLSQSNDSFVYVGNSGSYYYNRHRLDALNDIGNWSLKGIFDFESIIGEGYIQSTAFKSLRHNQFALPFTPYFYYMESASFVGRAYVYRLYAKYQMENASIDLGLQRVPFGVGRMWNPTDKYNPVNALSVEPSERLGIFGVNYINYVNELSVFQVITNFKRDMELDKIGLKYKSFVFGMDMGASYIKSQNFVMTGIELETNVFDTGLEARAEIAVMNDFHFNKKYTRGIIGIDYAFPFMLNLVLEYFYNGLGADRKSNYDPGILYDDNWNLARHYLGATFNYSLDPLSAISFSTVLNLVDYSWFSGLSLSHSLTDESIMAIGTSLYSGDSNSEFGSVYKSSYYVKVSHFF